MVDYSDAECIPAVHLNDYLYYGNASTYILESLPNITQLSVPKSISFLSGRCEIWKTVISTMIEWAVNNSITNYW